MDNEEKGARCMWLKQPAPENFLGWHWSLGNYEATGNIEHYVCGSAQDWTRAEHLIEEDPTGEYPRECDFTPCTRNCEGRSCGDDGCGGTCGGCGDYRDCVDFQCVDRIAEPSPDAIDAMDAPDSLDDVVDVVPDEVEPPTEVIDDSGTEAIEPDSSHDDTVADQPVDDTTQTDVTKDDSARTDVITDDTPVPTPAPGCGCSASTTSPSNLYGPLFVLLVLMAAVWQVRRRSKID